jgi:hypothetical protein
MPWVLPKCFTGGVFCENLIRDVNGVLARVAAPFLNLDLSRVAGVDVDRNTIPTYSFTNLRFAWRAEMANGGDWTVSLAINNALPTFVLWRFRISSGLIPLISSANNP